MRRLALALFALAAASCDDVARDSTRRGEVSDEPAHGFVPSPDLPPNSYACDELTQNCAAGERCVAWANDNTISSTTCRDLVARPRRRGESCDPVGNGIAGIDDCGRGLMCWFVSPTGEGTCIESCLGSIENPVCSRPGEVCRFVGDDVGAMCTSPCDPLAPDCPLEDTCDADEPGGRFSCWWRGPLVSGSLGLGEPCVPHDCAAGLTCLDATLAPGCDGPEGCCTPLCDLAAPACSEGATCEPWFAADAAPAGQEHVGACLGPR